MGKKKDNRTFLQRSKIVANCLFPKNPDLAENDHTSSNIVAPCWMDHGNIGHLQNLTLKRTVRAMSVPPLSTLNLCRLDHTLKPAR